jgi:DNA-binding NtrC family response regulator
MDLEVIEEVKRKFGIVGNNKNLLQTIETAIKVATTDMSVLILGESGVGKENISKLIHQLSKRRHQGFIAVNCGALPEGTIDSELFGHEKGAFTSAIDTRKGYFESVDKGTIFLDEIGELPLETQSRLLRVLENGEFMKVGSSKVQKTDVRIVAATNKDLLKQAEKGKFREDLYYRLSTISLYLPPLRERKEDIPLLFAKFANDFSDKYNIPPIELSSAALNVLINQPWQGNIRQLRNFIEQLSVLETDRVIDVETLQKYLPRVPSKQLVPTESPIFFGESSGKNFNTDLLYSWMAELRKDVQDIKLILSRIITQTTPNQTSKSLLLTDPNFIDNFQNLPSDKSLVSDNTEFEEHEEIDFEPENFSLIQQEKEMIKKALLKHKGKRKDAAKELGISERTLYRKIKDFEIDDV